MPTQSKPSLMIALGVGKPDPRPPDSVRSQLGAAAEMYPRGGAAPEQSESGPKASQQEAQFRVMENMCGACANWTRESGDCSKVEGTMKAGDGCAVYFEGIGGGQPAEPDADDIAGMGAPLARA